MAVRRSSTVLMLRPRPRSAARKATTSAARARQAGRGVPGAPGVHPGAVGAPGIAGLGAAGEGQGGGARGIEGGVMVRDRGQGGVVEPVADDHGRLAERHRRQIARGRGAAEAPGGSGGGGRAPSTVPGAFFIPHHGRFRVCPTSGLIRHTQRRICLPRL